MIGTKLSDWIGEVVLINKEFVMILLTIDTNGCMFETIPKNTSFQRPSIIFIPFTEITMIQQYVAVTK